MSCHDAHSYVSNTGDDWSSRDFSIECTLGYEDTLSYQDSFKYYDMDEGRAYNDSGFDYDHELDTTDRTLVGRNYDSWHDEYTDDDLVTVYSDGGEFFCSEERLDDFIYVRRGNWSGEYHYHREVQYCEDIDGYVDPDDAYYSEILDEHYYDEAEMERAEQNYKERNWTYSQWDDEYFEDCDDVVTMHFADGRTTTISVDSADANFEFEVRDGEYYEINAQEEAA